MAKVLKVFSWEGYYHSPESGRKQCVFFCAAPSKAALKEIVRKNPYTLWNFGVMENENYNHLLDQPMKLFWVDIYSRRKHEELTEADPAKAFA